MTLGRIRPGAAMPVAHHEAAAFSREQWNALGEGDHCALLQRCQADPTYQRWVLACLQVRISIQADQTFPHPPDRRAEIGRLMVAAHQRRARMLENPPV